MTWKFQGKQQPGVHFICEQLLNKFRQSAACGQRLLSIIKSDAWKNVFWNITGAPLNELYLYLQSEIIALAKIHREQKLTPTCNTLKIEQSLCVILLPFNITSKKEQLIETRTEFNT